MANLNMSCGFMALGALAALIYILMLIRKGGNS